jgi:hypothetical protein
MPYHHPSPLMQSNEEGSAELTLLAAVVTQLVKDLRSQHAGIQAEARLFMQEGHGLAYLADFLSIDVARLAAYVSRTRREG